MANWLVTHLKVLEAQGRGFTHGHGTYIGHPNGREELQQLLAELDADASQIQLEEAVKQFNSKLIAAASTMQYECATLPGRQLGEELPAEPFSYKQQRQSKLDGGVELDGSTHRAFLAVTPTEPWGHVAEERLRASAELREPRHPYKELPLTNCQLSLYPAYRWPQSFGKTYKLTDEGYIEQPAVSVEDAILLSDGAFKGGDAEQLAPVCARKCFGRR